MEFFRKSDQRTQILRLYGGGRSLERTALSLHFPAKREFNRELLRFWAMLRAWRARHAAQFAALSCLGPGVGLEKNREFFRDIREPKFPVMGFEQRKFVKFSRPCREKRSKFTLHSRHIFFSTASRKPEAGIGDEHGPRFSRARAGAVSCGSVRPYVDRTPAVFAREPTRHHSPVCSGPQHGDCPRIL